MNETCPISKDEINENVARMNGLFTLIAMLLFVFAVAKWIIFVIGVDFFLRALGMPRYSPMSAVSKSILKALKAKPEMVNAGPKMFAAKIGFACCYLMAIFYVVGLGMPAIVIGCIMITCASLEAFLGYCVGCKMHTLTQMIPTLKLSRSKTRAS